MPRVVKQAMCDRPSHDPDVRQHVANDGKEEPVAKVSWDLFCVREALEKGVLHERRKGWPKQFGRLQ